MMLRTFGCGAFCGAIATLALGIAACSSASVNSIDPKLCKRVLDEGGSASAYTRCLLTQAQGKSVGGIPILSERARSALQDRENDPCMADEKLAETERLACELARPPQPATTNKREDSSGKAPPLPLTIQPTP